MANASKIQSAIIFRAYYLSTAITNMIPIKEERRSSHFSIFLIKQ